MKTLKKLAADVRYVVAWVRVLVSAALESKGLL